MRFPSKITKGGITPLFDGLPSFKWHLQDNTTWSEFYPNDELYRDVDHRELKEEYKKT